MSVSDKWDGEVVDEAPLLNRAQIGRLMAMTAVLQDRVNLLQVVFIKNAIFDGFPEDARELFAQFSEAEQKALWVDPTKGGIFTTHERKVLRPSTAANALHNSASWKSHTETIVAHKEYVALAKALQENDDE